MNDSLPLQKIRSFPSLVKYLRDELDWPIETNDFEDLTFEFQPDELGIDPKTSAKIRDIKQLRPLTTNQPWGIFFISFEPKRLPVAALRKILGALVLRKRASRNTPSRSAWQLHDLLFISAFGEGDDRKLTLAHFSEPAAQGDLPTLRVLDWDGDDTALKVSHVESKLRDHLKWATPSEKAVDWRKRWASAFSLRPRQVITTAKGLAEKLAVLASSIRDQANAVLSVETEKGALRKLYSDFKTALIHELDEDDFADMYAQTITYGLFSAAVSRTVPGEGTTVQADNLAAMVPVTNPFLREMLSEFLTVGGRRGKLDFDELGVHDVVEVLNSPDTHLEEVLRDFGNRGRGEDPVIHFYEDFLRQYDNKRKIERGVFYTPQPVVAYIVRSVHESLQVEFGLEDGLASTVTWGEMVQNHKGIDIPKGVAPEDPFIVILDPATGTATFLVEVIEVIRSTMVKKWTSQGRSHSQIEEAWNAYVPAHLLPRLHGYELMMAPYSIAHMKIGLKLGESPRYNFASNERARIFLTNALDAPSPLAARAAASLFEALGHEAQAVNAIKREQRFTVIIGNPPYANYSANLSAAARRIVDKYRSYRGVPIRERNQLQFERNIQDDFVKFISVAEDLITASGVGIVGYITNGTMLASTSLRGMREHLMQHFNCIYELNLHGGVNEILTECDKDENVFDIAQSVAIHVYVKSKKRGAHDISHSDLFGSRSVKYAALAAQSVQSTSWRRLEPGDDNCSFAPRDEANVEGARRLDSLFVKFGAGIKTNRDAVAIGFDDGELLEAVRRFKSQLATGKFAKTSVHPLLYRPFDVRRIFYHEDTVASRSLPTMKHVLAGPNIGFVSSSTWTTPDRFSVNVSRLMVEMKTGTHDRGTTFFPLYRYDALFGGQTEQVHNLSSDFVKDWCRATGTTFVETGSGNGSTTTGPEDVFNWLYALFHSPEYRRRYRAALSQRFPIVFFPASQVLLRSMTRLGADLVSLHLLEAPVVAKPITQLIGGRSPEVEKISWSADTVWLDKAKTVGFKGVAQDVWGFHVGGYPVCEKWLKDRKGRILSAREVAHYEKVVVALAETIRLMDEVDKVIVRYGGWPGALIITPAAVEELSATSGSSV